MGDAKPHAYIVEVLYNADSQSQHWRADNEEYVTTLSEARAWRDDLIESGFVPEHVRVAAVTVVLNDDEQRAAAREEVQSGLRSPESYTSEPADDTLPQWLAWRFGKHATTAADWAGMSEEDRLYWAHEAAATRRAVARGGFKPQDGEDS